MVDEKPSTEARASLQPEMSTAIDAVAEEQQVPRPDVIRGLLHRGLVSYNDELRDAKTQGDAEALLVKMRACMEPRAVPLFLVPMRCHQPGIGPSEIITLEAQAECSESFHTVQLTSARHPIANYLLLDLHYEHHHGGAEPFGLYLMIGGGCNLFPSQNRNDLTDFRNAPCAPTEDNRNHPWESKLRSFPVLISPNQVRIDVGCRPRILLPDKQGEPERVERNVTFRLWAVVTPLEYAPLFAWKSPGTHDLRPRLGDHYGPALSPHPAFHEPPSRLTPDLVARLDSSPHTPFRYPSPNGDHEG